MALVCDRAELGLFPAVRSLAIPLETTEMMVLVPPAVRPAVEAETAAVFQSLQTYYDEHNHLPCSVQRARQILACLD